MSRHRAPRIATAFLFLATVLLCVAPPRLPAAPAENTAQAGAAERLPTVGLFEDGPTYPPQQYLPLALRYVPPSWSGTARFGFAVVENPIEEYNVSRLGADWYVTFAFDDQPPTEVDLEYVQTIRLSESGYLVSQEAIESYARLRPGTLWLIGNEPDAPAQDCVTPERYAELYHELYGIIKGADTTAQVAIGGVVQATPLRLQYLDMILDEYQDLYGHKIPVDVWNVHGFILQEKKDSWGCQIPCGIEGVQQGMLYSLDDHDNMTIFHQQIHDFRIWMKENGERNKPLIVSEYGILMPESLGFDEPRVEAFMLATFDYFLDTKLSWLGYAADDNRLVQAWIWYSLDDDDFEGYETYSHLFDPDSKSLTALGRAYRDYTSPLP